jgi:hypothetical protein
MGRMKDASIVEGPRTVLGAGRIAARWAVSVPSQLFRSQQTSHHAPVIHRNYDIPSLSEAAVSDCSSRSSGRYSSGLKNRKRSHEVLSAERFSNPLHLQLMRYGRWLEA